MNTYVSPVSAAKAHIEHARKCMANARTAPSVAVHPWTCTSADWRVSARFALDQAADLLGCTIKLPF